MATIDNKRAELLDFTTPYLQVEQGYLVRAGVAIAKMADVDRAGIRVGVIAKSASQTHLAKSLKDAKLVEVGNLMALKELIVSGKADAIAIGKPFLYSVSEKLPGSQVLDGAIIADDVAVGVVKGRNPAGLAYANRVVDQVKAGGVVKKAIERDKLRGVKAVAAR